MNVSNQPTNIEHQFCRPDTSPGIQTLKVLAYTITILVSLLGNGLIIAVVYKKQRMRTPVNFFVVNRSAADLLVTVFYMPRMISRIFLGLEWGVRGETGHFLCKVAPFTQELSASVSVLTLILIAIDRFFAVVFPLRRIVSNTVAYTLIAVVWLTAIAVRAPMFYGLRFIREEDGRSLCTLEMNSEVATNVYVKFAFVLFYVIPLFLLVVLYSAVYLSLKKRNTIGVTLQFRRRYKDRVKRTKKVMSMLSVTLLVFAVGWCLHFFMPILFRRFKAKVCKLLFVAFFLGHCTSAINPCIYLVYIENYRRGIREILQPLWTRCCCLDASRARVAPGRCAATVDRPAERNTPGVPLICLDATRGAHSNQTAEVLQTVLET